MGPTSGDKDKRPRDDEEIAPQDDDAQVGVSDSNIKPHRSTDSVPPKDSILQSMAEPVNQGRGILGSNPNQRQENDPNKTELISDIEPPEIPDDSIMQELAEPESQMIDFEAEHRSIRLQPGSIIAKRFRVQRQLGAGGMGAVYLVEDIQLEEQRALKVMLPRLVADSVAQQRFLTEIKVLQRLSHERIVRIHDLGIDEEMGLQFFTMENVPGITLHKHLFENNGRLAPEEVIDIAQKLCEALMYAHRLTIHRDLKPANVMIGEGGHITILDFGLAKLMSPGALAQSNMVMGTFHYQSPEQRYDPTKVDRRTDIFSLGVMIYEMLTGEIPAGQFEPPSKIVKGIPKKLDKIVMKCLQAKPERRYQSAGELYDDLEAARSSLTGLNFPFVPRMPRGGKSTADSSGAKTPTSSTLGKAVDAALAPGGGARRGLSIIAVLVVVTLMIVGAYALFSNFFGDARMRAFNKAKQEATDARAHANTPQVNRYAPELVESGNAHFSRAEAEELEANIGSATRAYEAAYEDYTNAIAAAEQAVEDIETISQLKEELQRLAAAITESNEPRMARFLDEALNLRDAAAEAEADGQYREARALYEDSRAEYEKRNSLHEMLRWKADADMAQGQLNRRHADYYARSDLTEAEKTLDAARRLENEEENFSEAANEYAKAAKLFEDAVAATIAAVETSQERIEGLRIAAAAARDAVSAPDAQQHASGSWAAAQDSFSKAEEALAAEDYVEAETSFAEARNRFNETRSQITTRLAEIERAKEDIVVARTNALGARENLPDEAPDQAPALYETAVAALAAAEEAEQNEQFEVARNNYIEAERAFRDAITQTEVALGRQSLMDSMQLAMEEADRARGNVPLNPGGYGQTQLDEGNLLLAKAQAAAESEQYDVAAQTYREARNKFDEASRVASEGIRQAEKRMQLARSQASIRKDALQIETAKTFAQETVDKAETAFARAVELAEQNDFDASAKRFNDAETLFQEAFRETQAGIEQAILVAKNDADTARTAAEQARATFPENATHGTSEREAADALLAQASEAAAREATGIDLRDTYLEAASLFKRAEDRYKEAIRVASGPPPEVIEMNRARAAAVTAREQIPDLQGQYGRNAIQAALNTFQEAEAVRESSPATARDRYARAKTEFESAAEAYRSEQIAAAEREVARQRMEQARNTATSAQQTYPAQDAGDVGREDYNRGIQTLEQANQAVAQEDYPNATALFTQAAEAFQLARTAYDNRPQEEQPTVAATTTQPAAGGDLTRAAQEAQSKLDEKRAAIRRAPSDYPGAPGIIREATSMIDDAKGLEASNPAGAIAKYKQAVEKLDTIRARTNTRTGM